MEKLKLLNRVLDDKDHCTMLYSLECLIHSLKVCPLDDKWEAANVVVTVG